MVKASHRPGTLLNTSPPESLPPPRLLRETKSTSAALVILEKGIKAIYQKDFKKARAEFKSLLETYPEEAEILARVRSYLQICSREESAQKKPVITNDQLYTLGVMEHNRGNFPAAIDFFRQSLQKHQDADYVHYSMAASLSMHGDAEEAVQALRKAIQLNEENRIYAKNDVDFSALHSLKEFADLVGINHTPPGNAEE